MTLIPDAAMKLTCAILCCSKPTSISPSMCEQHTKERERMTHHRCEICGVGGYEWGVLVPEVRVRENGRKLCHKCHVTEVC